MWGLMSRISYFEHLELDTSGVCVGGARVAYPSDHTPARIALLHVLTTEKHARPCQTRTHATEKQMVRRFQGF